MKQNLHPNISCKALPYLALLNSPALFQTLPLLHHASGSQQPFRGAHRTQAPAQAVPFAWSVVFADQS